MTTQLSLSTEGVRFFLAAMVLHSAVSVVEHSLKTSEISEFVVQSACESLQHELGKGASPWAGVPTFAIQETNVYFLLGTVWKFP